MRLKALVVDDEALARQRLQTLLQACREPEVEVLGQAANASEAMEFLRRMDLDVALVDIHMPGADGLALAQVLRSLPRAPAVVFVTAHAEHAVQAFELSAVDYLTKPVRLERLQVALQKVERTALAAQALQPDLLQDVIVIQERGRTERVPLAEVLYFKAELKYLTVRTRDRSHILEGSLSELEARYGAQFVRIHRNALVARRAIRTLEKYHDAQEGDGWAVRIQGVGDLVAVSRRQLPSVRELLLNPCS